MTDRVPIRHDGVCVRVVDQNQLLVILHKGKQGKLFQWWYSIQRGKSDRLWIGPTGGTKQKEQYLLLPLSILNDWNKE